MKRMIAAVVLACLAAVPAARADKTDRETFSAFAVDLGGAYGATSSTLQITVDRWSSEEDRRRLEAIFLEKGDDALLDAVQKMKPVGRLRTPGRLGYDLRFAYQVALPTGGRRIIVGADRPMSFYEASRRPRSADYPFTILEMRVDEAGRGNGKMIVAARVNSMGETIDVENYSNTPVRLTQVRLEK